MFILKCICLLSIGVKFAFCEQFVAKQPISVGSTISIDASVPQQSAIAFYDELVVKPFSVNAVNLHNFTDYKFGFGVLQVHSCLFNLTLSYNETIQRNYNENGTNLGFVVHPSRKSPQRFFIHNFNYFTSVNISVAFVRYNKTEPQPGGCNMEYSVADAPVLVITPEKHILTVDTPLASSDAIQTIESKRCNASLNYMGYHLYLKRGDYTCRTFFDGIKSLLTVDDSIANGKIAASIPGLVNRRIYTSIPGTGMIFQTIVNGEGGKSVYVPSYTPSCYPPLLVTCCDSFETIPFRVLASMLIIIGIIRAYFGEALSIGGVFIDGLVVGLLFHFYLIYEIDFDMSDEKKQLMVIFGGLVVAIILTMLQASFKIDKQSTPIISNIIVGYLLGALTVYMADDLLYEGKVSAWIYEIIFLGFMLFTMIILPPCHTPSPIVLSATWGTFCIIQGLCYLNGNHLNYMLLNALRYTSVDGFRQVHSPDLSGEDMCFLLLWIILTVSAIMTQMNIKSRKLRRESERVTERTPLISRMLSHDSDEVFE